MILSLALAALALQSAPLRAFADDGGTTTHEVPPTLLPLLGSGTTRGTVLRIGNRSYRVWVRSGLSDALFVDANLNGKPDAGEAVAWSRREGHAPDGATISAYQGKIRLPIPGGGMASYAVRYLVSNTRDPDFAEIRNHLLIFPLYGFLGTAKIGSRSYRIGVRGGDPKAAALFIDRDGDGVLGTVPAEMFPIEKPFNLDGQSYRVASFQPFGKPSIAFARSSTRVAETPMPPDLRVGRVVPSIVGRTLTGGKIAFPQGHAGKVVMLDVWATWCNPCRAEIPYIKDAYARFKGRGFDVVSFSIDDDGMQKRVASLTKGAGMVWTQAYGGQGFAGAICQRYAIESIPFSLLVDGTTGRILAKGISLRGPNLAPTIAAALAKRR